MAEHENLTVRPVCGDEIPVWAHVTMATVELSGVSDEVAYAERFAAEPEDRRREACLVWRTDTRGGSWRAIGRLRMNVSQGRAVVWALGLLPEVESGGLVGAVAWALEDQARRIGAGSLTVEVDSDLVDWLTRAGFFQRRARVVMEAHLVARVAPCEWPMRHPNPDDPEEIRAMGQLMHDGYRGSIDYDGETVIEGMDEVRRMVRGDYGTFLPDCSYQIDGQDGLAGAAWITQDSDDGVFLAEVMVQPGYRGRGMGRSLIQSAMNACLAQGWTRMRLMVTHGNVPAEGLYRRMGFVEVEGTDEYHMEKELQVTAQ